MRRNEHQLLRRLRDGEAAAYAEFVDAYGGRVHGLARRYARSEADAEDLTQEIFVDLCRGIASFRGDAALSTCIYRVALNHCLRYQGRLRPEPVSLDDVGSPEVAVAADGAGDPLRHTARRELADQVDSALASLTPTHRDVVLLHELHGLTYAECAAVLSIPVGTVKSRLSHAFGRLRSCLGAYVLGQEPAEAAPARDQDTAAFRIAQTGRAAK